MAVWIVLIITLVSHIGLIIVFEQQRKKLASMRDALRRHRQTITHLESQVRLAARRLTK